MLCTETKAFSDIGVLIIAIVNLLLLCYELVYNRRKHKENVQMNNNQFKMNIMTSNFSKLFLERSSTEILDFYRSLSELTTLFLSSNIRSDKFQHYANIETLFYNFEENTIGLLNSFDPVLYDSALKCIDEIRDYLPNKLFNEIQNTDLRIVQDIKTKIIKNREDLIKLVYQFSPK